MFALPRSAIKRERNMTSEQIRKLVVNAESIQLVLIAEIAAQLVEHNAHLDRLEWLAENVISLNCGGLQVKVTHD
jgi:hypothetical protein